MCLDMAIWRERWSASEWRSYLGNEVAESEITAIRQCTHTGRPFGTTEFIKALEPATQRQLAPQKGGRVGKLTTDERQEALLFDE